MTTTEAELIGELMSENLKDRIDYITAPLEIDVPDVDDEHFNQYVLPKRTQEEHPDDNDDDDDDDIVEISHKGTHRNS